MQLNARRDERNAENNKDPGVTGAGSSKAQTSGRRTPRATRSASKSDPTTNEEDGHESEKDDEDSEKDDEEETLDRKKGEHKTEGGSNTSNQTKHKTANKAKPNTASKAHTPKTADGGKGIQVHKSTKANATKRKDRSKAKGTKGKPNKRQKCTGEETSQEEDDEEDEEEEEEGDEEEDVERVPSRCSTRSATKGSTITIVDFTEEDETVDQKKGENKTEGKRNTNGQTKKKVTAQKATANTARKARTSKIDPPKDKKATNKKQWTDRNKATKKVKDQAEDEEEEEEDSSDDEKQGGEPDDQSSDDEVLTLQKATERGLQKKKDTQRHAKKQRSQLQRKGRLQEKNSFFAYLANSNLQAQHSHLQAQLANSNFLAFSYMQ